MTATAEKDRMRIIAVVMGEETSKIRNQEVSEMLDYAFAQYKVINMLKNKNTIGEYRVENGKDEYVLIVPKEEATMVKKKSDKDETLTYDIKIKSLKAPLKVGDDVGTLTIKENGQKVKTVKLTVAKDVDRSNFGNLFLRNVKDMITGNMNLN